MHDGPVLLKEGIGRPLDRARAVHQQDPLIPALTRVLGPER